MTSLSVDTTEVMKGLVYLDRGDRCDRTGHILTGVREFVRSPPKSNTNVYTFVCHHNYASGLCLSDIIQSNIFSTNQTDSFFFRAWVLHLWKIGLFFIFLSGPEHFGTPSTKISSSE